MKLYLKNAIFLLGEDRQHLPCITMFFVLISILDLVSIGIVGPFLGIVFSGKDSLPPQLLDTFNLANYSHANLVSLCAAIMILVYGVKSVFGALIAKKVISFSQDQQVHIRKKLITSYQHMSYSDMIRRNSSEYINAIQLMVPNFANLVMVCLQTFGDGIVAIMIVVFLAWTNPFAFGFLVVITGICLIGFDRLIQKRTTEAGQKANSSAAAIVQHTHEALHGFKEIRVLEKERFFKQKLLDNAVIFAQTQNLLNFFSILPKHIFEMIIIIFIAGMSVAASHFVKDPVDLIPTLGIFGMASIRMMPLARNFSFTLNRIRFNKDTVIKLTENLAEAERLPQNTTPQSSPKNQPEDIEQIKDIKDIELINVAYAYPESHLPALNGISLKIKAGEHIGIVGPSGAGKTTLVDTLLGLLPPSAGTIMVNQNNITTSPHVLWQHVAYLPQDIFITDGSVRSNIALGVPDDEIDGGKMTSAITQAQMSDVISALPHGLDTPLGENGVKLSGGQRQRIALARAFYFNRRVLVLDEATSALDMETEAQIINYLNTLKGQITVISITHRLKSLDHCDRILTIDKGRINSTPKKNLTRKKS